MTRSGLGLCVVAALLTLSACRPGIDLANEDQEDVSDQSDRPLLAWSPAVSSHAVAAPASALPQAAAAETGQGFSFAAPRIFNRELPSGAMANHRLVAAGDFNGDGLVDIAALTLDSNIELYLQGSAGITGVSRLQSFETPGFGPTPIMVVNDFNEDGIDDIAMHVRGSSGAGGGVGLMASQGPAQLPVYYLAFPAYAYESTSIIYDWTSLDVNGDGHQDIVTARNYNDCGFYVLCPNYDVLLGDGSGHFSRGSAVNLPSTYHLTDLYADDIDSDGHKDLVLVTQAYSGRPEGQPYSEVFVAYGRSQGGIQSPQLLATNEGWAPMNFGDVNGDGRRDVAMGGLFFIGQPSRDFSRRVPLPMWYGSPGNVALADFDGDGFTDVVNHQFETFGTIPFLAVYLQREGTAQLSSILRDPPSRFMFKVSTNKSPYAVGDFNSDGCKDLAVAVENDGLAIYDGQRCSKIPTGGNQAPRPMK